MKQVVNRHIGKIFVAIILLLAGVVAYIVWSKGTAATVENQVIKGVITEIATSCGLEKLQSDGTVKHEAGICDGGNSIVVDGKRISTGGGMLGTIPGVRVTDISDLSAGDTVQVKYVIDDQGNLSTNCDSCYVRK